MIRTIHESVLRYDPQLLAAWEAGDKSIIPPFVTIPADVRNQPKYWFGEMFTLRAYHDREGWLGFASYALGNQFPGSKKRAQGRRRVEEIIPAARLARLRALRQDEPLGAGEPDLFLYNRSGAFKFVEVKKKSDRIRPVQLRCIAQILAVLRCTVDIVYLCALDQRYQPKQYVFDLTRMDGRLTRDWS